MQKQSSFFFAAVFALLIIAAPAFCEDKLPVLQSDEPQTEKPYYSDNDKKGYWWQDIKPEKKEVKKEEKKEEKKARKLPSLKEYPPEKLWTMHPDDFRPLMQDFLKRAVQNPTEQNVKEYYTVMDIMRRKSMAFTNVTGYVMQKYPELSVDKDYPTVIPGKNALLIMQIKEITSLIRNSRDDFALLYFYSPVCPYCQEQDGILKYFIRKHEWEVKKLELESNTALASSFGVSTVPYLILIYKHSKDFIPISAGVIAIDEMEMKIYKGIRLLKGEITPEEYNLYEFEKERGSSFNIPYQTTPNTSLPAEVQR